MNGVALFLFVFNMYTYYFIALHISNWRYDTKPRGGISEVKWPRPTK